MSPRALPASTSPMPDCGTVPGGERDDAVQEFLRAYAVPKRLRDARVSDRLSAVEPTVVPTRWGDLMAWRLGAGPAILVVHGWEDDNSLWSPLIDELYQRAQWSRLICRVMAHRAEIGESVSKGPTRSLPSATRLDRSTRWLRIRPAAA